MSEFIYFGKTPQSVLTRQCPQCREWFDTTLIIPAVEACPTCKGHRKPQSVEDMVRKPTGTVDKYGKPLVIDPGSVVTFNEDDYIRQRRLPPRSQ